jgi:hypothetical protein
MLRYADQPTPPFNSPYQQHTSKKSSLLEAPYPSPDRHDSTHKYPEGLGLYSCYQPALPTGLPPSPQPSESWNTAVSPLMTEALADPWASGAFDHPISSHSPLPWATTHPSPRSSLSSCTREMSVFSHDGSEQTYPGIKVEYSPWGAPEMRWGVPEPADIHGISSPQPQPLTVAPERLNAGMYSFDNPYGAPQISRIESTPVYGYGGRSFERAASEDSNTSQHSKARSNYSSTSVPRERGRNRRHTDPSNAAYRCPICENKGFARRYNYNQHMLTHDAARQKPHACAHPHCTKEFVRKTDLSRHDQSVHQRSKPFKCSRCPQAFSRKDTLRR